MLRAGVALADISPAKGVPLAGYPHLERKNTGIHDPIHASVLYLSDGTERLVLVNTELLYFGKEYLRRLRAEFPDCRLIVTATHTHCAPWASELLASEKADGFTVDGEYINFLTDRIRGAIREAMEHPFAAEAGVGSVHCGAPMGIGGNRHRADGICDDSVGTLAVREKNGRVRFVLVNYALHPTLLHEDVTEVSGDYPAYIRRFMKFAFPDAVFGFAQGCSGDQSTRYFRVGQTFEEAARVGTTIAVEAFHCIGKMHFTDDLPIGFRSAEVELPLKHFPAPEVAAENRRRAEEAFRAVRDADALTRWNAELRLFGAQSTEQLARLSAAGYRSPELPLEISWVRLGDYHILTSQGELFAGIGIAVKKLLPKDHTLFFAVTNGSAPGYLYTEDGVKDGGYEYGNSMFAENAHEMLYDHFQRLITGKEKQ